MTQPSSTETPILLWDCGTAYELFISLHVLHQPETYGLRAAWAAGIRSRIPAAERKFLEEVIPFLGFPLAWVHQLPQPKDATTALYTLHQTAPAERLLNIIGLECCMDKQEKALFQGMLERRAWTREDLAAILQNMTKMHMEIKEQIITNFLDWWVRPVEAGEMLLKSLQAYQQVFFEEEEKRVGPVLTAALQRAQELAKGMSLTDLLIELSRGVNFNRNIEKELILVPGYWTTPLALLEQLKSGTMVFLFGARPDDMSATPGELVPDGLLRNLKALADSTRLKILYYLSQEELTPSELARRLHLRAPTLTHHLTELRLAGLVNLTVHGLERRYSARREALKNTFSILDDFLESKRS
jgi:DNA-binding transcriptional ArsR family regulator